ncbi:MAG: sigma-70 family RNA polymerase sigma factor [Monoglobales bacterium]
MEVTEEQYQRYYRPWWQQKKREQRNREAMEANGYTEESYDGWKDGILDEQVEMCLQDASVEEIIERQCMLEILEEALESLMPEEKELAVKVLGEQVSVSDFAKNHSQKRTTVSSRKMVVLGKLRQFFRDRGFEI